MIKQRWELKIGSPVMATDGRYGRLKQVILDPHQERIVALLVQRPGLGISHTIVVPEEAVADANDSKVQLKIGQEQADALPEYKVDTPLDVKGHMYEVNEDFYAVRGKQGFEVGRQPNTHRPGVLEDQLATSERESLTLELQAGHQVFCTDGHAGKVNQMLLDPKGRVKGFVMRAGHLPGRDLIVPVAYVRDVDRQNVHLSIVRSALEKLADYSPDFSLATQVDDALWADDILRVSDYDGIGLKVESGIVELQGHVVTQRNRLRAENAARSVAGVLGIQNHLVVDGDLVLDVARALDRDERTHPERVFVGAQKGVITLTGQVASTTTRDAAEEVAASLPQVRGVVNYLNAPHVVVDPEEQRFLEPPIGREVAATDMLLGNVERVIIDPHNRRVSAFVAAGYFPDQQHPNQLPSDDEPLPERRVVVPIRVVSHATDSSVLLTVSSKEAAQFCDFDPAGFISPPRDWQPPYPYQRDDVLFIRRA